MTSFCFESRKPLGIQGCQNSTLLSKKLSQVTSTVVLFFENWCLCIGGRYACLSFQPKPTNRPCFSLFMSNEVVVYPLINILPYASSLSDYIHYDFKSIKISGILKLGLFIFPVAFNVLKFRFHLNLWNYLDGFSIDSNYFKH